MPFSLFKIIMGRLDITMDGIITSPGKLIA